jgi:capsular exopolysaccharide synthesis family protein
MTIERGAEPAFHTYLLVLRRRQWWVITLAAAGLAASLAFSLTARKQYSATAQLLVEPSAVSGGLGTLTQQPVTQTDVQTELQLVTSAQVQAAVRRQLGETPRVAVSEVGQTNVVAVTATSPVPARAARIANTYARAFVGYRQAVTSRNLTAAEEQLRLQISSLQRQVSALRGTTRSSPDAAALLNQEAVLKGQLAQMQVSGAVDTGGVVLVTPAQAPASPSSPKPVQNALLGLAAGLAVGLAAAFGRDSLDDRLTSKEAAEHAGGIPVLALIPLVTAWRRRQQPLVVSVTDPNSQAAESYRSLRTSLQFTRQERRLRSLVVTSPAASEGKTSTLANLGVAFAQAGDRVVMLSGDLRRPRLGRFFGVPEDTGLTSVLRRELVLDDAVLPVAGHDRLWLLPSGPIPPNPADLLGGVRACEVITALEASFDLVLIDAPPVLPVTDAVVLARHADATLMVIAGGQTRRADLHRAMEKLEQVSAPVLGTVLNQVARGAGYGYCAGQYGYKPYLADPLAAAAGQRPNGRSATPSSQEGHR